MGRSGQRFHMTRAVVFDFDGTLVDTMSQYADIASAVISRHHPEIDLATARARYIETSGLPFCQQVEIILPGDPLQKTIVDEYEAAKIQGLFATPVDQEVFEVLARLRRHGLKTCISSGNFPNLIRRYLRQNRLKVDLVMGFEQDKGFQKGKPHFDFVMRTFRLSSREILFVGDSLKDADKAMECDIPFIGKAGLFARGEFAARYPAIRVVGSLRELVEEPLVTTLVAPGET